jgi:hypothetical protein
MLELEETNAIEGRLLSLRGKGGIGVAEINSLTSP